MCGISGAVGLEDKELLVQSMTRNMVHRGPDSDGFFNDSYVSFGVRRLKVIDLESGDQPISNESGDIITIHNGEIYNYRELRQELQGCGHLFTTNSDTEVIVHAYEQWGIHFPDRLQGMFAIALWDKRFSEENHCGRLLLVRDRLGIKPLYLWSTDCSLLFASEVRALLHSGVIKKQLSRAGLYTYLLFGSVQEPLSIIEGVYSLQPGTVFCVDVKQELLSYTQDTYWAPRNDFNILPDSESIRNLLQKAINSHLVSDVPLGAFLSGGLDSGAIVAFSARALSPQPLQSFTLAFDNWPLDERNFADMTAHKFSCNHHTKVISESEVFTDLHLAIRDMDQPSYDGVNTWFVAREAHREGLAVALSGLGGDELFAGYPSFRYIPLLKRVYRPKTFPPHFWERLLSFFPGNSQPKRKLGSYLDHSYPFDHPYFAVRGLFTPNQIVKILSDHDEAYSDESFCKWRELTGLELIRSEVFDRIGEVSWLEMSQYMRSTLLRDTDSMSMAHSLEVRVPFLDHSVIEGILSIEAIHKLNGDYSKPLLSSSLVDILPAPVLTSKKQTFTIPIQKWILADPLKRVENRLFNLSDLLLHYFKPDQVAKVWSDYVRKRNSWANPWSLYVLDEWIRINL